jgi:imidazolonepropionase-like amidohydrolase
MILIKNGKVLTMAGKTYDRASILVEGGKIVEIGEEIIAPIGTEVIDAEGRIVMPGIIDAHCHLGLIEDGIGFEGDDVNEMMDPVTPHLRAIDAINPTDRTFEEAREGGVSTVATGPGSANVIGGHFAVIKTHGDRIDDMIVKESVAMKCAFGENPKRVYHSKSKSPMTRMGTAAVMREALYKAKAYKEKLERAKDDPSKAPDFDLKMDSLVRVLNKEIPLKAHAHRADDILTALRIAKEFNVDITLEHCSEGHLIADYIAQEKVGVVVGPSFGHRTKFELKNLTFETPGILAKKGVKVAIMTDSPVIPLQYLRLCAGLSVTHGMEEEEAFKAITINAAEILGIQDRVGSLEVGKDADIAIFDGHPFQTMSNCVTLLIDGKIVHQS